MKMRFMEMPEDRMASISLLLDKSPMTMLEAVRELKGKVYSKNWGMERRMSWNTAKKSTSFISILWAMSRI
jgi:hypothetical protein